MTSNIINLIGLLSLSAVFTVIADTLGKKWVTNHDWKYFAIALFLMLFGGTFFLFAMKYQKLGIISVTWDAITSVALIAIGYFLFKESLSATQLVGMGMIFVAMFLIFK